MDINWNMIFAGAIIVLGLTEYIKSFDRQEKLKSIYGLFPLGISILAGLTISGLQGFSIWSFVFNNLLVLGFSIIGYESILKFVKSLVEKLKINK